MILMAALVVAAVHPLDPPTAEEIATAVRVLHEAGRLEEGSRFPHVALQEPSKDAVLADTIVAREISVVVKDSRGAFEAVVDVARERIASWTEIAGQPALLPSEEWQGAAEVVREDPTWLTGLGRRGDIDPDSVVCVPYPAAPFARPGDGRRLVFVVAFDGRGVSNFWGRPIEGLVALVDLDSLEVLEVTDAGVSGPSSVPSSPVDFHRDSPRPPPERLEPPDELHVDGWSVRWHEWLFRFRVDPRVGLVVSQVRWREDGQERSVLYRGSLSELFVPYMDPGSAWFFRAFLDAGEHGIGKLSVPLVPGLDCPTDALLFSADFADDRGGPYVARRAACLFERWAGNHEWRHYEAESGRNETRRRTSLMLRSVVALGNYDYVFDWEFRRDGTIAVHVTSSGVPLVKGVDPRSDDDPYGWRVAPDLVGVNHDHWFCFRLDLDVDGPGNRFVMDRLEVRQFAGQRRSGWVLQPRVAETEKDARLVIDWRRPALWRIESASRPATGYHLKPATNAIPLLDQDDPLRLRAGFLSRHLWVTPYSPAEMFASGPYPWRSAGDGVSKWTEADRPIRDTDIVLWYTLGFHHVVRKEDWPVMPASRVGFELRPFDFFDRNPALGVD